MTHVTVGKPIDWQQWQLDQAVRSVRMQVDRDGDLYALPVVIIDPTKEKVITASAPAPWYGYAILTAGFPYLPIHVPPAGRASWITKVSLDFANGTILGGAVNQIIVQTLDAAFQLFHTRQFFPAVLPNPPRPSVIWDFGSFPISAGISGLSVGATEGLDALTQAEVHCWGYDV